MCRKILIRSCVSFHLGVLNFLPQTLEFSNEGLGVSESLEFCNYPGTWLEWPRNLNLQPFIFSYSLPWVSTLLHQASCMNWENREAQYTPRGDVNTASLSSSENPGASCEVTGVFLKLHPMLCCPKLQTAAGSFPLLEKATCNWSSHHLFLMACKERNSCLGLSPRGLLNKVLYGKAPPRGPTPYHFIYHYWQIPLPYTFHWQMVLL